MVSWTNECSIPVGYYTQYFNHLSHSSVRFVFYDSVRVRCHIALKREGARIWGFLEFYEFPEYERLTPPPRTASVSVTQGVLLWWMRVRSVRTYPKAISWELFSIKMIDLIFGTRRSRGALLIIAVIIEMQLFHRWSGCGAGGFNQIDWCEAYKRWFFKPGERENVLE